MMFSDREGCRFLCLWGSEGIDPWVSPYGRTTNTQPSDCESEPDGLIASDAPPLLRGKLPHRADPCIAKHHSIMQQLTLQFDGYAPIGQAKTQGTAKQCKSFKFSPVHKVLEGMGNLRGISLVSPAISMALSRVKLFSQAAAAVTFGFGLMFLASIIGG